VIERCLLEVHRAAAAQHSLPAALDAAATELRTGLALPWVLVAVRDALTGEQLSCVLSGGGSRELEVAAPLLEGGRDRVVRAGDDDPCTSLLALGDVDVLTVVPFADGHAVLGGTGLAEHPRLLVGAALEAEAARAVRDERERRRATLDGATGLPGPLLLEDVLRAVPVEGAEEVALLLVSVDQLRNVTRSFGRAVGNEMLRKVAARLLLAGGAGSWSIYRLPRGLGLLTVGPAGTAEAAAERVMTAMQEPWTLGRRRVRSTCRIGVAVREEGQLAAALVECAEAALDAAAALPRPGVVTYSSQLTSSALEELVMETLLHAGLAAGELRLRFQPQVDIATGAVHGAEALVRWHRPSGLVSPARFIPAAEATGLIVDLDRWVLRSACAQAKDWTDKGLGPLRMAVNVSSATLAVPGFADLVLSVLAETGLAPDQLEVEITESLELFEGETAVGELARLRAHGVHVAIDDFGTGYSNVGRLRHLPVDRVKIDQAFVRDIVAGSGQSGGAICDVIVGLARTLDLDVIAEGVETEDQRAFLEALGCPEFQGYLRSAPLEAAEFEALVLA
jgi:EAL domain-containing protein (putative c-di-GMP-specific phosphodiesterase class I)/GGDEF domain-containing protein